MARATGFKQQNTESETFGLDGEMLFLAIPTTTYKALSDLAMKRGLSVGQLLEEAISTYLHKEA